MKGTRTPVQEKLVTQDLRGKMCMNAPTQEAPSIDGHSGEYIKGIN